MLSECLQTRSYFIPHPAHETVPVVEVQGQDRHGLWKSGDIRRAGRWRGTVGVKWEVVWMGRIKMGPQSQPRHLDVMGWAMQPLEGFEQVRDLRRGWM